MINWSNAGVSCEVECNKHSWFDYLVGISNLHTLLPIPIIMKTMYFYMVVDPVPHALEQRGWILILSFSLQQELQMTLYIDHNMFHQMSLSLDCVLLMLRKIINSDFPYILNLSVTKPSLLMLKIGLHLVKSRTSQWNICQKL